MMMQRLIVGLSATAVLLVAAIAALSAYRDRHGGRNLTNVSTRPATSVQLETFALGGLEVQVVEPLPENVRNALKLQQRLDELAAGRAIELEKVEAQWHLKVDELGRAHDVKVQEVRARHLQQLSGSPWLNGGPQSHELEASYNAEIARLSDGFLKATDHSSGDNDRRRINAKYDAAGDKIPAHDVRFISLRVKNKTGRPLTGATFRIRIMATGRTVPLAEGTYSKHPPGGIEPGEEVVWQIQLRDSEVDRIGNPANVDRIVAEIVSVDGAQ